MTTTTKDYYSMREVAQHFSLQYLTVWKLVTQTKKIAAIRIGRAWRIPESEVKRLEQDGLPQTL